MTSRIEVLAQYLEVETGEIAQSGWNENLFEYGNREYLVLTDEEADERVTDYIKDSLWAFNAWFLAEQTGLDSIVFEALQPLCESANDAILSIVEKFDGLDDFVEAAVQADSRGHFLNAWDGTEDEVHVEDFDENDKIDTLYVYRT